MSKPDKTADARVPALRVGSYVEVRSAEEIMATLDPDGSVEKLPFMPEMLAYCGRRFRVFKRVDKVIDMVDKPGLRRMSRTVLLEDVRCDGRAHDGCQASCQLLWKEEWLRKISDDTPSAPSARAEGGADRQAQGAGRIEAALLRGTRKAPGTTSDGEIYRCQATEVYHASAHLPRWDVAQYLTPLLVGNITLAEFLAFVSIKLFNLVQALHGGARYPHWIERSEAKTPTLTLNLVPGELVMVKSSEEIQETLSHNRNRGLWFDQEMLKFCGGRYRVLRIVDRLIDEPTGKLLRLKNPAVILDGVTATGEFHRFYPQNDYPIWREIWLRRVPDHSAASTRIGDGS